MSYTANIINKVSYPAQIVGRYGYLYNGYAILNALFAPTGWRVPLPADYASLRDYLGGGSVAGGKLKESGTTNWQSPNTGADNASGFTGLPGGRRYDGNFEMRYQAAFWWVYYVHATSSYYWTVHYLEIDTEFALWLKKQGLSVRLVTTVDPGVSTITDFDTNVYNVIHIGAQWWLLENWKCTKLNDGTLIPNVTDTTDWEALTTMGRCAYDNNEDNV
jgi:uncharacterized protein (TIGR02145 family)